MGKQRLLRLGHPALLELKKINMKNAFTLIETIIAIFILAVGITAVLTMFPLGIQIVNSSKMATIATHLAQEKIEEIISTPYGEISDESEPTLASPFNAYSRENIAVAPGVISYQSDRIKNLEDKMDLMNEEFTQERVSSQKLRSVIDGLTSENKTLKVRLNNLEMTRAEDQRVIKRLTTENESLKGELKRLEENYRQSKSFDINNELGTGNL